MAATVIPQIGSMASVGSGRRGGGARGARGRCRCGSLFPTAHGDDAREDRQRDLAGGLGADVEAGGDVDQRRGAPWQPRRRAARRARRRRAWGWPRGRCRARPPPARGAACAARPVRAPRRRARDRRRTARGPPPSTATGSSPSAAPSERIAPAIGVSPTTRTRGAGRTGSRKISIVPPDRQVFRAVTAPSSIGTSWPCSGPSPIGPSGTIRNSNASSLWIAFSAYTRTLCCAHMPPMNPSIVPSASTSATSPALTLVGRCARTTVAVTNTVPWAASSCARRDTAALIIAVARDALAWPPRPGRACRACRGARRRARRAARR